MTPRPEARLSGQVREAAALLGLHVYSTEAPRTRGPSGNTPGIPDLIVLDPRRRRAVLVELKTPTGRLTAAQRTFQERARASGLECVVWTCPQDVLDWLNDPAVSLRGGAS